MPRLLSCLLLIVFASLHAKACPILATSISSNSSFALSFPTNQYFEVQFYAYIQESLSDDFNNYISFQLRDLNGNLVHNFPPLTGKLEFGTIVSSSVSFGVTKWPSNLNFIVNIISPAKITLYTGISAELSDFFSGEFRSGLSVTKSFPMTPFISNFFSFSVPRTTVNYDMLFTILNLNDGTFPFSAYCIDIQDSRCLPATMTIVPEGRMYKFSSATPGNYSATFVYAKIGVPVTIIGSISVNNNTLSTTTRQLTSGSGAPSSSTSITSFSSTSPLSSTSSNDKPSTTVHNAASSLSFSFSFVVLLCFFYFAVVY